MVVILHLNLFSGLLDNASISDNLCFKLSVNFYEQICVIAVNVFVIISSWFLSAEKTTSIKTKRIFRLVVSMYFWYIITILIAVALGVKFEVYQLFSNVPIIGKAYGFITGYLILFFASPFLNKLTSQLSYKSYLFLVLGVFLIFSLFSPLIRNGYLYINSGYSFVWFIFIFLIVGFVKTYFKWGKYSWKIYFVVFFLLTLIGTFARIYAPVLYVSKGHYNDPIIFLSALSCFLLFASIRVKSEFAIKIISFFVPLSVAVFFIHANPFIEQWFSTIGFSNYIDENTIRYMAIIPVLALLVFIVCTLCEYIREKLFSILGINKLVDKLSFSIDKHLVF